MFIAIAEHGDASQDFLERYLKRWGFDTELLASGDALLARMAAPHPPQAVLLRWGLPGPPTREVCARLRSSTGETQTFTPHTHLIALVGRDRSDAVLEALRDGLVDDVLVLPLDAFSLEMRLAAARKSLALWRRLERTTQGLEAQAMKDGLTGLWNREASLAFLRRELVGSGRDGSPVGVALLAIRDLAAINRACGHQAGDQMLRSAADALHTSVRTTDWAGRFSGATVMLVLPGCSVTRTQSVAARLARGMAAHLEATPLAGYRGIAYGAVSASDGNEGVDQVMARVRADMAARESAAAES